MQMVRNIVILLIVLPLFVVFFMPKKELYFLLEKRLSAQNITISGEVLQENLLGLTVEHPTFYLGGASIATAKEISLWSILFYTEANFYDLQIARGLPTELKVNVLHATHSVLSPLEVYLASKSSLGAVEGEIRLKKRMIHLNIAKDGTIGTFAKFLKKSKKGWVYESGF